MVLEQLKLSFQIFPLETVDIWFLEHNSYFINSQSIKHELQQRISVVRRKHVFIPICKRTQKSLTAMKQKDHEKQSYFLAFAIHNTYSCSFCSTEAFLDSRCWQHQEGVNSSMWLFPQLHITYTIANRMKHFP